jgi:hypothetical protein
VEYAEKQGSNRTQSLMEEKHGVKDLEKYCSLLCPDDLQAKNMMPSIKASCKAIYMFGYTQTMHYIDVEPNCLGTLRLFWPGCGSVSVLMISMTALQKAGPNILWKDNGNMADFKKWLQELNEKEDATKEWLTKLKELHVEMFSTTVSGGQALITPPGYLLSVVVQDKTVYGIRRSFLPQSQTAVANLGVCVETLTDDQQALKSTLKSSIDGLKIQ